MRVAVSQAWLAKEIALSEESDSAVTMAAASPPSKGEKGGWICGEGSVSRMSLGNGLCALLFLLPEIDSGINDSPNCMLLEGMLELSGDSPTD